MIAGYLVTFVLSAINVATVATKQQNVVDFNLASLTFVVPILGLICVIMYIIIGGNIVRGVHEKAYVALHTPKPSTKETPTEGLVLGSSVLA